MYLFQPFPPIRDSFRLWEVTYLQHFGENKRLGRGTCSSTTWLGVLPIGQLHGRADTPVMMMMIVMIFTATMTVVQIHTHIQQWFLTWQISSYPYRASVVRTCKWVWVPSELVSQAHLTGSCPMAAVRASLIGAET